MNLKISSFIFLKNCSFRYFIAILSTYYNQQAAQSLYLEYLESMSFLDFIFGFEQLLPSLLQQYGLWIYALLFMIIFCETAFVFMFFLPGDSLLFTIGALCSTVESMHVNYMIGLLSTAAFLGYIVNYHTGRYLGGRIFNIKSRFVKQEYLYKTHEYFLRHGGKTILIARFIPFVRSFAPLAAGSSGMNYFQFMFYNVLGALFWMVLLIGAGYLFGHALIQVGDLVES